MGHARGEDQPGYHELRELLNEVEDQSGAGTYDCFAKAIAPG